MKRLLALLGAALFFTAVLVPPASADSICTEVGNPPQTVTVCTP